MQGTGWQNEFRRGLDPPTAWFKLTTTARSTKYSLAKPTHWQTERSFDINIIGTDAVLDTPVVGRIKEVQSQ